MDVGVQSSPPNSAPQLPAPQKQEQSLPHTALAPAALWCTPGAARNFTTQLQSSPPAGSGGNAPLTLAPGESLAIQVPTSPQAAAIFWEFATERGDIGFGLRFEWTEKRLGSEQQHRYSEQLLPVTVRDCSQDLVLGSHQYQAQGVYTLDFVNAHSSLPKTVHYRVFYQTTVP